MYGLIKKMMILLSLLVFLTSGLAASSAITSLEKATTSMKTVTMCRYGIDGSIRIENINIMVKEGQYIEEIVANKCSELLKRDIEIQGYINNENTSGILAKIWSRGRGIHLKFMPRIQLIQKFKLFPLLPPYFRTAIILPTLWCNYPTDVKARTEIIPLLIGENISYDGPHRICAIGFIGYMGWIGRVSLLGFGVRTGFAGYTMLYKCTIF